MGSNDNAFGSFLASRRARVTPEQLGIPSFGRRRVPGLRRSELANLAGISSEYLARLERGAVSGVSDGVVDALSRALELDDAEREHLIGLGHVLNGGVVPRRNKQTQTQTIRPNVQMILDAVQTIPALVRNGRGDFLATNTLARAMYSEMFVAPARPVNSARFIFLEARSRLFYPNWDKAADDIVAVLRGEAGRDPYDRGLSDLVGELSTRSEEFRTRWALQNVRNQYTGRKHIRHPDIGDIRTNFETMTISADEGLSLLMYPPTPGTAEEDTVRLLASWQATPVTASVDADT